jgi:hypothetical protein
MMETVTRVAVWGFAIVVAITQLGIATTLINTILIGLIGGVALAFGLAFGLGGRDRAAQVLDTIGRTAQRVGPQPERAANAAREGGQTMAQQQTSGESQHSAGSTADGAWAERSKNDRRQVNRPGLRDRRGGNGSSS